MSFGGIFASVMRKIAGYLTKNRSEKDQKIAQSTHENAKKNFLEKFKTASKSLSFYGMFFKTLFHLLICFLPVVILLFSYIRLLIEGFSAKLHIAKRRKSGWYGINRWTLFRWKSSPPISPVFIAPFCPEMQVGIKEKPLIMIDYQRLSLFCFLFE